ncbi:unnamed protein product [Brassica rapa subsp. trilocularis]
MNVMKVAEHGKKSQVSTCLWQSHRVHQHTSYIMSAADMAMVIQWFPGNRRPEHVTFYVIHYQLVYESKQCEHCVFTVRAASERSVLVEMIDSISVAKESMSHLKAVYFIRSTSENIQKLRYQLANPRFGEHHLFFSNLLKDTQIHILADSDKH